MTRTSCEDDANFLTRQSEPNQFGLHDMLGVWGEYCSHRFNSTDDPALAQIAEGNNARVVRGMRQRILPPGCFLYSSDHRFPAPGRRQTPALVIGVRLVLQPKSDASDDRK